MDSIDFHHIRLIDGSQRGGFEEFCCQLARRDPDVPPEGVFRRLRGDGGDGGVECYWQLPNGDEWGYQSKFFFQLSKGQLDKSVSQALATHPALRRYVVCIPFDPTGPTGRAGKSEVERWDDYVEQWKQQAHAKGMSVDFVLWPRNELLERLQTTGSSASRIRFWFGQEKALEPDWFAKQISASIAAAGPRYSPTLRIDVPIAQCFEALANTDEWERIAQATTNEFDAAVRRWRRSFGQKLSTEDKTPLSPATKSVASELSDRVDDLTTWLAAMTASSQLPSEPTISDIANQAVSVCDRLESACLTDLENKHGDRWADTPGWRQFMAGYQCCFPEQYLDAARDFLPALRTLDDWLANPIVRLPTVKTMLVTGFAGSGKTHAFCDAASQRLERGLPSVLLLGEQFVSGEPWDQIRRLLGLGGDWSRDDILAALDALGEASDNTCIVFIDALNDTVPRTGWKFQDAGGVLLAQSRDNDNQGIWLEEAAWAREIRRPFIRRPVRRDL